MRRPVWILHVFVVGLALHNLVMAELWIGSIFTPWAVLGGVGLTLLGMLGWGWQSTQEMELEKVDTGDEIVEAA